MIKTIEWKNNKVVMLDQRELPHREVYNTYSDYAEVARAIETMVIRGAPAIGIAGAMGVALGALGISSRTFEDFFKKLEAVTERLARTRPTAVNLFWALHRMKQCAQKNADRPIADIVHVLCEEALSIQREDLASNHAIGRFGEKLVNDGENILTHCNAGGLATAGYGTALAVMYSAVEAGKRIRVYADETRPRLQGASLTAWELQKHGIHVTVIADTMAASLMKKGKIDRVIVGADRIAMNGDVANKIGTYAVALAARYHDIPFYVAAPLSTIDPNTANGDGIPIEERDHREVTHIGNQRITPELVDVINPAFDVTPADLVTAIITDRGIAKAPYQESLANLFEQK